MQGLEEKEAKFRVWDQSIKAFLVDPILRLYNDGSYNVYTSYEDKDDVNYRIWKDKEHLNCIVVWYTGRRDKSGKEMYERDIVNCLLAGVQGEPEKQLKLQVVNYDDSGDLRIGIYGAWFCCDEHIVGNLFENPELLKGD